MNRDEWKEVDELNRQGAKSAEEEEEEEEEEERKRVEPESGG